MKSSPKIDGSLFRLSWFSDVRRMNLKDPMQEREWIRMVLERGKTSDVRKLDLTRVKYLLPYLRLSPETRSLWQNYFSRNK